MSQLISLEQLQQRCEQIAGLTLSQLAQHLAYPLPTNAKRQKGWAGMLIEHALGAVAGSKPEPDFLHLGIELKTLPLSLSGKPLESTFVSVAPLTGAEGLRFEDSVVYHKLQRVLWLPILGERSTPIEQRFIGQALLWQPNAQQWTLLRRDWEELMEAIALGYSQQTSAHLGEALQLRPKAADASVRTKVIDPQGLLVDGKPKGFYLRPSFTRAIFAQHFII